MALNTNSAISTIITSKTITYIPKLDDIRLSKLDRYRKYTREYKGEIKKSLKQ